MGPLIRRRFVLFEFRLENLQNQKDWRHPTVIRSWEVWWLLPLGPGLPRRIHPTSPGIGLQQIISILTGRHLSIPAMIPSRVACSWFYSHLLVPNGSWMARYTQLGELFELNPPWHCLHLTIEIDTLTPLYSIWNALYGISRGLQSDQESIYFEFFLQFVFVFPFRCLRFPRKPIFYFFRPMKECTGFHGAWCWLLAVCLNLHYLNPFGLGNVNRAT